MDHTLKYRITAWVVILFMLILLPSAINKDSQVQTEGLVSGLGIDASPMGIEVSAQLIIPQPSTGYAPKTIVASAENSCMLECIRSIELDIGQRLGLAHCYVVIVGDELCDRNLTAILDFLVRSNVMANNTAMFHTEGKAKDLLAVSSQLSAGDINNLQNLTKYDRENYAAASLSLFDFYKEYMLPSSCSVMNTVVVNEKAPKGDLSSSGGGGGNSEGDSPGVSGDPDLGVLSTENVFDDKGKIAVFKKGVRVEILGKDDAEKMSRLDGASQRTFIKLYNFSDQNFKNVDVCLAQTSKRLSFNPKLANGIPILEVNIELVTRIESVKSPEGIIYTSHLDYYTPAFVDAAQAKVKQDVSDTIAKMKAGNYDLIDIYSMFNIKDSQAWKKFLAGLENPDNYLQDVEVFANVTFINRE